MTTIDLPVAESIDRIVPGPVADLLARRESLELFAVDLYRDIHKGIRGELFAITSSAGALDPDDAFGRVALAEHVRSVVGVLESHAHHEDAFVDAPLAAVAPQLAAQVNADHEVLDAQIGAIAGLAEESCAVQAPEARRLLHVLHLELSDFTGAYLRHQLVEERQAMPALAAALTFEEVLAIHVGIVSSIQPEEMARSLAFMLPAMNADDRAELLGGLREAAPAEAFESVLGLACSVLDPAEYAATADRLGIR